MEQLKLKNMEATEYQGWKNYQTWNVALWLNNEESYYNSMVDYLKNSKRPSYMGFIKFAGMQGELTPDRIKFDGTRLDYKALNKMIVTLLD